MKSATISHANPKDFFLHLLATATLFVSIISLISLIFQYINAAFPDQLSYYFLGISESIRWATSALIIVFPVYILSSWLISRDIAQNPDKRDIRIRRWLMHFTLFVAAITIIIDLITLIYNYLGGELSIQFFLKTLTVLIVAAAVFGYYIWDLRRKELRSPLPKRLAWSSSIIILATIIAGFFIVGTPGQQRTRRFDEQRVNHIQIIQNEIVNYWVRNNRLPGSLDDLKNDGTGFIAPKDPETDHSYEYIPTLFELSFELCATFKTDRNSKINYYKDGSYVRPAPYPDFYQQNWDHPIGHYCFKRTIDPTLYKDRPKLIKDINL